MECFITHISTACVLIEIPFTANGRTGMFRILTDPVFDTGSRNYRFGPFIWETRFRGPAIPASQLRELHLVLLSHTHHLDNLDESGKALLGKAKKVITSERGKRHVPTAPAVKGLKPWEPVEVAMEVDGVPCRVKVTATPAKHGLARDVVGFVLEWDGQETGALYISGDTVYFDGIEAIAKRPEWKTRGLGVGLLHLGGVHFFPPLPSWLRFTFNAREAVQAAQTLGLKKVIPIHYERTTWTHFKEDVADYHRAFGNAGLRKELHWLPRGERTALKI